VVSIEWIRHPNLPGLEVLRMVRSTHLARVFSEAHVFALAGACAGGEWRYRRFRYDFLPNTYSMTEAGEAHWITKLFGPYDLHAIYVEPAYLERFAAELEIEGEIHFELAQAAHPEVTRALGRLFERFDPAREKLELESLLVTLFATLISHHAQRSYGCGPRLHDSRRIAVVREQLITHFADKVGLAELASSVGLSRYHLVREFSRAYGFPPHAFQMAIRVERARHLITQGMPLAEVADVCGFADQSHLCRAFKKGLGIAPGIYRSQARHQPARASVS
jgi:AraC-like DNA-binding protein